MKLTKNDLKQIIKEEIQNSRLTKEAMMGQGDPMSVINGVLQQLEMLKDADSNAMRNMQQVGSEVFFGDLHATLLAAYKELSAKVSALTNDAPNDTTMGGLPSGE